MRMRTTRITVEREMVTIIRRSSAERSWCRLCAAEVDVVAVDSNALAEILAECTARFVNAETELHVSQDHDRPVRICLPSLLRCFEPQQAPTKITPKEIV